MKAYIYIVILFYMLFSSFIQPNILKDHCMPGTEVDNRQYSDGQYIYGPWFDEAHNLIGEHSLMRLA